MNIVFILLLSAAFVMFYLSLPPQKLLARPLALVPARLSALFLLIIAFICGYYCFSIGTAIFALLLVGMLTLSVIPFLSLLKKGR